MSNNKVHLDFLDYLRGVAILAVFLFHSLGFAYGYDQFRWGRWFSDLSTPGLFLVLTPFTFGWAGVAIFFVVSGFCIHLTFLKGAPNDWHGFFVRRFFRIYPPYFFALAFFALAFPISHLSFRSTSDWVQFGTHVLLMHNFDKNSFFGINPAFWSIAVEFQLYLLYPALIAMVSKLGWQRSLIIIGFLEIFLRAIAGFFGAVNGNAVPTNESFPLWFVGVPFYYWFSWAIGAALADAYVKKRPLPFRSISITLLIFAAIGTAFVKWLASFSFLFFALLTVVIIARLLHSKRPMAFQRLPDVWLCKLGVCSYSFYLLHQPLLFAFFILIARLQFLAQHPFIRFFFCIGIFPPIFLLSWIYHEFIELKSIAIAKQILQRRPAS